MHPYVENHQGPFRSFNSLPRSLQNALGCLVLRVFHHQKDAREGRQLREMRKVRKVRKMLERRRGMKSVKETMMARLVRMASMVKRKVRRNL